MGAFTPWFHHSSLPPPFNTLVSYLVLEHVPNADVYLLAICIVLTTRIIFHHLPLFARPPPVPLKSLPRRPILQILFKPDENEVTTEGSPPAVPSSPTRKRNPSDIMRSIFGTVQTASFVVPDSDGNIFSGGDVQPSKTETCQSGTVEFSPVIPVAISDGERSDSGSTSAGTTPATRHFFRDDLPDSFAPLLSSGQVEILRNQLSADLIHAIQVKAAVRIREGRHEIPLDKDSTRPQLILDVPKGGCRVSVAASVGSDGMSAIQDMDVIVPATSRSRPMAKEGNIVLDPPLPLANVAPTLIHFPSLFEDKMVPHLRRIQIVRYTIDAILSFSSFIERVLWIIESKCQIHLGKVQVTPLYKGNTAVMEDENSGDASSPDWRLTLAFSGHVLLFGWIPIPFISITLPSFIIPQPHALLENLLTPEPLASAKLRRENIQEKKIALATLDSIHSWNVDLKMVATPPAVGVDVTLPGGVAVAVELMHGRDLGAGVRGVASNNNMTATETFTTTWNSENSSISGNSVSSFTSTPADAASNLRSRAGVRGNTPIPHSVAAQVAPAPFDANKVIPWSFELVARGSVSKERLSLHLIRCAATHENTAVTLPTTSCFSTSGSVAIWRAELAKALASKMISEEKKATYGHLAALASSDETPSVGELLLYPIGSNSSRMNRLIRSLQYDYAFEVADVTCFDCVTLSVGASHPMLNGGTMVTTNLESIYALGSVTAREGALMEAGEWRRKRNILKHLPVVDFTFGIQNAFIPSESLSYTDDGQTLCFYDMEGGRMMVRIIGGFDKTSSDKRSSTVAPVTEGIKLVADFGFESLTMNSSSNVKEFPELEIYDGDKLKSLLSGSLTGRIASHLRPQGQSERMSSTGPNKKNPLEAHEIGFSGSSISFKIKESTTTLGHRRIIIPTETSINVKIEESVVDMSLEGKTQCELSWDFQGLSPILQTTTVGMSPADADHENKEQVPILIAPLRQGRLNFNISECGGLTIKKAATVREDREGLYDWKFFNAIISPDESSGDRLLKVVHDRRTMEKLLQVVKLVNRDLHKVCEYIVRQVWRAKEIFDQESITDAGKAIPGHKMARLVSLFLSGDVNQVDEILPVIRRVVRGEGLDVVKAKELLRRNIDAYDDWAPEIDRGVRWAAVLFGPMAAPQPYVEASVPPLSALPKHAFRFSSIPSARQLYEAINDQLQLPLEASFSHLVSKIAPYLSFRQVEYFLKTRSSTDWQPLDLKRLRYVYSVKKKVLDISESYGGLSFLPQSFLVSVFLGEATRASLRASRRSSHSRTKRFAGSGQNMSTLTMLRLRRIHASRPGAKLEEIKETTDEDVILTPAARVASQGQFVEDGRSIPDNLFLDLHSEWKVKPAQDAEYELGDSLLGPQDVAVLLQAGLTSAMKSSTVVQLNQRMLLDLMAGQPSSFAVAVLAEIGTPGGQGSPRGLTSALMALLELDQSSFKAAHRLDMHALLESWLPGFKVPRRDDYMAGGRWARQSYYEAIFSVAKNILEDAECYMALKGHVQRSRVSAESDPVPQPREFDREMQIGMDLSASDESISQRPTRHSNAVDEAKSAISDADTEAESLLPKVIGETLRRSDEGYKVLVDKYNHAFRACAEVLEYDKLAFHAPWFAEFYRRNYNALMVKSMVDNVVEDVDDVRYWFRALSSSEADGTVPGHEKEASNRVAIFDDPEKHSEQVLVDAIIDTIILQVDDRKALRDDPLVRLLIPNPPGKYNFGIVSAMGVITEGKKGLELQTAFERIRKKRGVVVVRADTGTARSFEFNAAKIEDAIATMNELNKPYGLLGYSQGCANALTAESLLLSGSPTQQKAIVNKEGTGLVCRQLLFSAANGSMHGPASDTKAQRLIVMCEEFFKYQQGYFSRALTSSVLEALNGLMDSRPFQQFIGGAQSMLPDGCRAFWRECQHLPHVPTCTLRGVLEKHTTPESLEMISNLLTKQSGSTLHDSQVHVYDAVGYPVYFQNRNGRILKACCVGDSAIQRTHHWSPLSDEVEFVRTKQDIDRASFDCAKDRHVFPWVDVNVRFGFIKYKPKEKSEETLPHSNASYDQDHFDDRDIQNKKVEDR